MNTVTALNVKSFDVDQIRNDFPILKQKIFDQSLAYLDNGASTQKPQVVIDAISNLYEQDYANVHRGIHTLSQRSTDHFEAARTTIKNFVNAASDKEIIFTSGTTEAINLVAHSFVSCLLYTSPSPRDRQKSRMPSSA